MFYVLATIAAVVLYVVGIMPNKSTEAPAPDVVQRPLAHAEIEMSGRTLPRFQPMRRSQRRSHRSSRCCQKRCKIGTSKRSAISSSRCIRRRSRTTRVHITWCAPTPISSSSRPSWHSKRPKPRPQVPRPQVPPCLHWRQQTKMTGNRCSISRDRALTRRNSKNAANQNCCAKLRAHRWSDLRLALGRSDARYDTGYLSHINIYIYIYIYTYIYIYNINIIVYVTDGITMKLASVKNLQANRYDQIVPTACPPLFYFVPVGCSRVLLCLDLQKAA